MTVLAAATALLAGGWATAALLLLAGRITKR